MNGRAALLCLSGLSTGACRSWSELSKWRLLFCGLEFQVRVRDFIGVETVYVDWPRQSGGKVGVCAKFCRGLKLRWLGDFDQASIRS
jgi:hypothetical protein